MRHHNIQPPAPDQEELSDVELLRRQVEYLRTLVHTDELTGLSNLRHFNETLSLELERTRRTAQPTCLILVDLDNFKQVNDSYGHDIGNSVLCHFAELIRSAIRRLDTPCRCGGDEFAIILPGTGLEQGIGLAERVRTVIKGSPFKMGSISEQISASMGVGVYEAEGEDLSEREFVEGVDRLLYLSKRKERGRICHPAASTASRCNMAAVAPQIR